MLKVKKECCGQCLFSRDKIVSDARKKSILLDCKEKDNHFICHKATMENKDVVCAGFYERHTTNSIRISQRMGWIEKVD